MLFITPLLILFMWAIVHEQLQNVMGFEIFNVSWS